MKHTRKPIKNLVKNTQGYSLLETMVAVGIGLILCLSILRLISSASNSELSSNQLRTFNYLASLISQRSQVSSSAVCGKFFKFNDTTPVPGNAIPATYPAFTTTNIKYPFSTAQKMQIQNTGSLDSTGATTTPVAVALYSDVYSGAGQPLISGKGYYDNQAFYQLQMLNTNNCSGTPPPPSGYLPDLTCLANLYLVMFRPQGGPMIQQVASLRYDNSFQYCGPVSNNFGWGNIQPIPSPSSLTDPVPTQASIPLGLCNPVSTAATTSCPVGQYLIGFSIDQTPYRLKREIIPMFTAPLSINSIYCCPIIK